MAKGAPSHLRPGSRVDWLAFIDGHWRSHCQEGGIRGALEDGGKGVSVKPGCVSGEARGGRFGDLPLWVLNFILD